MASAGNQRTSLEMLIELRMGDPEFRHAISTRTVRAGRAVAEPDVLTGNMLMLMKGRVQLLYESPNGRRLALATLNPGAAIWDSPSFAESSSSVRANALTECMVWIMPSRQAQDLLIRHPGLLWVMLHSLGERIAQVENGMEAVAYHGLRERLAQLLLDLSNGGSFIRAISHQTLADMLGTYRETISAILRLFKAAGLVELGYRTIELRDAGGLRAEAGYLPGCRVKPERPYLAM
jgi:CRP/FNR family transcriptional regulator, cyclic AMP receptor protein